MFFEKKLATWVSYFGTNGFGPISFSRWLMQRIKPAAGDEDCFNATDSEDPGPDGGDSSETEELGWEQRPAPDMSAVGVSWLSL